MRSLRHWLIVAIAAALPGALIVAGVVLMSDLDPDEQDREDLMFIPVDEVTLDDARSLSLSLTWSTSAALAAPAWEGLVTSIGVKPGDRVRTGTKVVQIDETWRLAAHTAVPVYAPITSDSSASLRRLGMDLLQELGYLENSSSWSWDTTKAIRSLAAALGVPHADGVNSIDPTWFVWIPHRSVIVGSVDAQVGAPAPPIGSPVVTLAPTLRRASIRQEPDQPSAPSFAQDEGPFTLTIDGAATTVPSFPVANRSALRKLGRHLAVSHPDVVTGTIEKAVPTSGWVVPATSVVIDERKTTCVLLRPVDGGARPRPLVVDVLPGGGAGVLHVAASRRGAVTVLANPRALDGPLTCG